jgi:hypothetical protein
MQASLWPSAYGLPCNCIHRHRFASPMPDHLSPSTGFSNHGSQDCRAQQWPVPSAFNIHTPTQSSTINKTELGYTYFLFAICAAVAAFGFSSMAALPVSQLP